MARSIWRISHTGAPINDRRYSNAELTGALRKTVAYAKCMGERGLQPAAAAE
jgi:hypothetical protein